ncbi:uncharacterized protein [Solanum lycopersicum]|uniref:uncharacterized protein n=1 Tax=Solanum lycopersicum TaxID=4081 RepID=UPI00374A290B
MLRKKRKELVKNFHWLSRLGVCVKSVSDNGVIFQNGAESSLVVEVKEKQESDSIFLELKGAVNNQRVEVFSQGGDGVLRYQSRLCVPNVVELRQHILEEAHNSRYSIHPGETKMYRDLQEVYWWNSVKWDLINMDLITGLPRTRRQHDLILIEILSLPLISGSHFKKVLELKLTLVQHFDPQMDGMAEHTIQT